MPDAQWELYYHIVWTTKNRMPMVAPQIEKHLHKYIRGKAKELGCHVVEVGGIEDHIHVLASMPPTVTVADLVKRLKGASSRGTNKRFAGRYTLYWQVGYSARSVSPDALAGVSRYVRDQRVRHASRDVWPKYEIVMDKQPERGLPSSVCASGPGNQFGSPE